MANSTHTYHKPVAEDYRQCSISVMDNIADPNITFDENGVSNYYYQFLETQKKHVIEGEAGKKMVEEKVRLMKESSKGNTYDCILGVSGGVDSTYLALKAKELGLNPLLVHFDNGWNSELAVKNIESIVSKLDFDLYTLVVNWEEFRDLQLSYFKASVVDIEALTDHAIMATMVKLAQKHNLKYFLSGFNVATESILPKYWIHDKTDFINIKDIHKHYGMVKLKTYPLYDFKLKRIRYHVLKIQSAPLLNYMDYDALAAKKEIIEKLGWRDYGGKHYESVFTRFYQGHILPVKFGIDKRKAHFSNLIFNGDMTKEEALAKLEEPGYDAQQLAIDKEFVLKKLGMTADEFETYLQAPRREHKEFKYELNSLYDQYPVLKPVKPVVELVKRLI